jgi:hypothetical protein
LPGPQPPAIAVIAAAIGTCSVVADPAHCVG